VGRVKKTLGVRGGKRPEEEKDVLYISISRMDPGVEIEPNMQRAGRGFLSSSGGKETRETMAAGTEIGRGGSRGHPMAERISGGDKGKGKT